MASRRTLPPVEQGATSPEWGAASSTGDPFRALAHTTPDAIVTADASNRITYANPAAEQLTGHRADELVGQPVGVIVPESQRAAHGAAFARFVTTREGHLVGRTIEVNVLRADGREVPVELSLGVAGSEAEVTLTAVMRDISQRVRHQRNTAAHLAVTAAVSSADTPDLETRIVTALGETLAWHLCSLWRVDGDHLRLSATWQSDPLATESFFEASRALAFRRGEGAPGAVWATAEPTWLDTSHERFLRAGEARSSGLVTGVLLPLITEGEVIGVLELYTRRHEAVDAELQDTLATVASQIAETLRRRQHAEDLVRSNRDLEHFASIAAHDLSEPLNTIVGFAELLEQRHRDALPPEAAEFAAAMRASAVRGREVLDGLLRLARAGSEELRVAPVDLGELVGEVLLGLGAALRAGNAEVEVAASLPTVTADRALLGQVFQNLLANAIKFRGEHDPRISVTADEQPAGWRISVADNGVGIAQGDEVFDLFRRAAEPIHVGSGIGLALSRTIVERHGGTIGFESRPGHGTTFHVTLPK